METVESSDDQEKNGNFFNCVTQLPSLDFGVLFCLFKVKVHGIKKKIVCGGKVERQDEKPKSGRQKKNTKNTKIFRGDQVTKQIHRPCLCFPEPPAVYFLFLFS
jgi:hypothetical protein